MTEPTAQHADRRAAAGLPRLHPGEINEPEAIRSLLARAQRGRARLTRGMNRRIDAEVAEIQSISAESLVLSTKDFEEDSREVLFLNFSLGGEPYFLQARILERFSTTKLRIEIPRVIYRRERRSRERARADADASSRVSLEYQGHVARDLAVANSSPEGIALDVPTEFANQLTGDRELSVLQRVQPTRLVGRVRHIRPGPPGWTRIGLELSREPVGELRSETIGEIAPESAGERWGQSLRIAIGGAQLAFDRALRRVGRERVLPVPVVVDFYDSEDHRLRGLLDMWGPFAGTTAVVIPPAWGRTKETLMPLAATIVECFRRAKRPISVLRFDGIGKRGESFREPECTGAGTEHHRFTFSQGVRDIRTAINYLDTRPDGRPASLILVSFSASSIEARRAVASDPRISGWVCVVGSADLQSMMRSISGGIDYALGIERGVKFGLQEILGVAVDMDLAGTDALEYQLVYMSDARRDMARIRVPVTWIRGRYDAWMDAERVRDAMSRGDTSKRKLIEVPTGHMLKSSRQALGVFQLVAREVGSMSGGPDVRSAVPNIAELERRRLAELRRLPSRGVDLKQFWSDYLLGRDRTIGFELMTLTSAYRDLMRSQIRDLQLVGGQRVVDLGSGTGAFPYYFLQSKPAENGVVIIEVDFVRGALCRARSRLSGDHKVRFLEADLDIGTSHLNLPFASASVDCVLASLLLSYVGDPKAVLSEIRRILRPGGRLVVSSLRRDADMSKLFVDGVAELRERWETEFVGWAGGRAFEEATRAYLNEASRLLDLEEQGRFKFWDALEIQSLLRSQGYLKVEVGSSFGLPPQATVASAMRPRDR